jgi:hypothetical protein
MKTPLERQHAGRDTRHHLLFEKPTWKANPKSRQVHEMGSYIIGMKRAPHDYLHSVIQPVPVPTSDVLDCMFEVGREYVGWQNDANRIDRMMDAFTGYAKGTRSPENAHGMLTVMSSLEAQMAIAGLHKGIRPRYE